MGVDGQPYNPDEISPAIQWDCGAWLPVLELTQRSPATRNDTLTFSR